MSVIPLDELDLKILRLVSANARTPFLEIARACNVSGAAIHQRMQKLQVQGVIKGSEYIIDPAKAGFQTCAYVGVYLHDSHALDSVVGALQQVPEVVECHYTTGKFAIYLKIYAHDNAHFLEVIHDKIQAIEGIVRTETLISLEEVFHRQIQVDAIP